MTSRSQSHDSTGSDPINLGLDPTDWLKEHGDALFRFAISRIGDTETAEDLVQEALLGGIKSIATFDGRSSIRTWLIAILKNKIRDHLTRAGRSKSRIVSDDDFSHDLGDLLNPQVETRQFQSSIEIDEFRDAMQKCVRQLPNHLEQTFALRITKMEYKSEQLCEELDISESNFNVRLFRARLLIRKCLEKIWLGNK